MSGKKLKLAGMIVAFGSIAAIPVLYANELGIIYVIYPVTLGIVLFAVGASRERLDD